MNLGGRATQGVQFLGAAVTEDGVHTVEMALT